MLTRMAERAAGERTLVTVLGLATSTPEQVAQVLFRGSSPAALLGTQMDAFEVILLETLDAAGIVTTDAVASATGVEQLFRVVDPNSVLYAREQVGELVVQIVDTQLETIRQITTLGQLGITTQQQARLIAQTVGLPPQWAYAPRNLENEILEGLEAQATNRRLSGVDKQRIRSRIRAGTADEAFAREMSGRYTSSLRRARANNIARTETRRAANAGQRMGWQQNIDAGRLPSDVKRFAIVTPDNRLRPEHAAIPGLNPKGRGMNEPFQTPDGPRLQPPFDPNCRCGQTLLFAEQVAAL